MIVPVAAVKNIKDAVGNNTGKEYADKGTVQFIEGVTFKTIIPVSLGTNGIIGGAIGGAIEEAFGKKTKGIKDKLIFLLNMIAGNGGQRTPDLIKVMKVSERSLERYLKLLKEADLIEYKGNSTQSGGYYLTEKMNTKITKIT